MAGRNKNKSKKNKKGFTFLEVMIAVFIFSIMMVAAAGTFAASLKGYLNAKAIQKDLEDAQYAVNIMAKTIRTSTLVRCGDSSGNQNADCGNATLGVIDKIKIYDYSQSECIEYVFSLSEKRLRKIGVGSDEVVCKDSTVPFSSSTEGDLIASRVENVSFDVVQSSDVLGAERAGRVTFSMEICPLSGCGGSIKKDKAIIQTTVSLRDFVQSGI